MRVKLLTRLERVRRGWGAEAANAQGQSQAQRQSAGVWQTGGGRPDESIVSRAVEWLPTPLCPVTRSLLLLLPPRPPSFPLPSYDRCVADCLLSVCATDCLPSFVWRFLSGRSLLLTDHAQHDNTTTIATSTHTLESTHQLVCAFVVAISCTHDNSRSDRIAERCTVGLRRRFERHGDSRCCCSCSHT